MLTLHVDLKPKAGADEALHKTFHETFRPAISSQDGFIGAHLLRPLDKNSDYRLVIAFRNRDQQQKWVATDLHQQVWPAMESHFERYTIKTYEAV